MRLSVVPNGLEAILGTYGDPRAEDGSLNENWYRNATDIYPLPFPMRTWGNRTTKVFRAHRLVGQVIAGCMDEIVAELGQEYLQRERWDFWGGCWWFRPMRGYDALSTHAWGIAVDLNPERAPLGGKPEDQHPVIAKVFKTAGFIWGGDWHSPWRNDSQHFQAARGY